MNSSEITELLNLKTQINIQDKINQMQSIINNNDEVTPPPPPSNLVYEPVCCTTMCNVDHYKNCKLDCYWFAEEVIMGGHVMFCRKSGQRCDCENCDKYLSRKEADNIIERSLRE